MTTEGASGITTRKLTRRGDPQVPEVGGCWRKIRISTRPIETEGRRYTRIPSQEAREDVGHEKQQSVGKVLLPK